MEQTENEQWAVIDLMGHVQTSGRISRPTDWSGLLRVDIPDGPDGGYRTEFYGMAAVYSIKLVSKEIAIAFAKREYDSVAYDAPIVTREQYEEAITRMERANNQQLRTIAELERRLTAIRALPAGPDWEKDIDDGMQRDEG